MVFNEKTAMIYDGQLNVLFSWTSATGILIDDRRVDDLSFLNAFLDPEIRLDIFVRFSLIGLDKVLKHFGVGIGENDSRGLCRSGGIASRVLGKVNSK